jgi:NAD(P)H-dependent FMN reductase
MVMNLLPGLAPAGMAIKEVPSFTQFPLYDADIQNASGFPAAINVLADAIRPADGVIGGCAAKLDDKTGALKDEATGKFIAQQLEAFAKFIE